HGAHSRPKATGRGLTMREPWGRTADGSARRDRQPGWSLSEFLSLLDLRGQTWCIVEIRTSGGLSLPPHDGVWFYSALKGSARIATAAGEVIELTSGQVGMILS